MTSKRKHFTPLILALMLALSWLTLLNTNSLSNSRAWAATQQLESQANDTLPSDELSITSVSPYFSWNDDEQEAIFINGSGFTMPLTATLLGREMTVTEVSSERITAVLPVDLPPGLYDVTVELANGQVATLPNGYLVKLASPHDDLLSFPEWVWTEPFQLREDTTNGQIGLIVQRLGGRETWHDVQVCFELDIAPEPKSLGCRKVAFLPPNSVEATFSVPFNPSGPGQYTICAYIDPDNQFNETNESNNQVCRTLTIQHEFASWSEDDLPPKVEELVIEDWSQTTTDIMVTLDVTATDLDTPDADASGVNKIEFIEFVYSFDAGRWVPVQRSGWVPYLTAHENYPWTLTTTYGVRYLEAWGVDKAGNISLERSIDVINLLPEEQVGSVGKNQVVFYRMFLEAGQTFSATLTSISGDSDLYVWGARDEPWYSTNSTGVDSVDFVAPDTGTYQIEVHGYDDDAQYRLSFGITQEGLPEPLRAFKDESKPTPPRPVIALENTPQSIRFNDISPPATYAIYLPMATR